MAVQRVHRSVAKWTVLGTKIVCRKSHGSDSRETRRMKLKVTVWMELSPCLDRANDGSEDASCFLELLWRVKIWNPKIYSSDTVLETVRTSCDLQEQRSTVWFWISQYARSCFVIGTHARLLEFYSSCRRLPFKKVQSEWPTRCFSNDLDGFNQRRSLQGDTKA